jgi:hypothetical protein
MATKPTLWVARDLVSNELYLYTEKPKRVKSLGVFTMGGKGGSVLQLPSGFVKEVTWENSPQGFVLDGNLE